MEKCPTFIFHFERGLGILVLSVVNSDILNCPYTVLYLFDNVEETFYLAFAFDLNIIFYIMK